MFVQIKALGLKLALLWWWRGGCILMFLICIWKKPTKNLFKKPQRELELRY
jgi:hypothetical protein